ncbi:MAG: hypothetical protein LUC98_10905 [Lachnospiraceae bacterium]|nr:hypothetical protein [Lachnospiraceae bacterium]
MAAIRQRAQVYIPEDFVKTAEELHEAAWRRMGTYGRVGSCTGILSPGEL